jgi:hypothetical protein
MENVSALDKLLDVGILGGFEGRITGIYPMTEHGCAWVVTTEAVYKVKYLPWYRRVWNWFTDWRYA